jgi:hypothetical protein
MRFHTGTFGKVGYSPSPDPKGYWRGERDLSLARDIYDACPLKGRSAVTNGKRLHVQPVGDTTWTRRFRTCSAKSSPTWVVPDFVCDRQGRRWLAKWRDDVERIASRTPRVRVALDQLKQWYRTLDQLLERKAETEHALFVTLRDLFSLQVDMVFYDLTSGMQSFSCETILGELGARHLR